MKKKILFATLCLTCVVLLSVCLKPTSNENSDYVNNIEALTHAIEDNPCNNRNGYKQWALSGFLQHKKSFYDCCYNLREGYSPEGSCE